MKHVLRVKHACGSPGGGATTYALLLVPVFGVFLEFNGLSLLECEGGPGREAGWGG